MALLRLHNALAKLADKFGVSENVEGFEQFSQVRIAESRYDRNAILGDDDGFVGQFSGKVGKLLLGLGDRELLRHGVEDNHN